jgi:hypothetical protein
MSDANNSAINSLLDAQLDDLADLPEFGTYPAGTHKVSIKWESKTVNNHPCIELQMRAIETVELANPTDAPLSAGSEGSVLFMLDNEFGQGALKALMKPLAAETGQGSISGIIEATNGMEVTVVTNVRQNKDKSQSYTNVKKILL